MVKPPIRDLNKCRAILMLRTAKYNQAAVAHFIGTSKKTVVAVDKWFRELHYEEAIEVCNNHALDCARVIELDPLKSWLLTENQNKLDILDKMDVISILGRYCIGKIVTIKEKRPSLLRPRPSEHHARLVDAAEKLRLNIKQIKQTKNALVGNITQGHINTPKATNSKQQTPLDYDVDRVYAACLLSHLKAMYPEFQKIESWENLDTRISISNISEYMIRKLKEVSHGMAITGTCEICRLWL